MQTLNAVDFASMAVSTGNDHIIVLDLHNGGSDSRWAQQFPSLTAEQIALVDETAFFHFTDAMEAIRTFERLTLDCAENGTGGLIGGTITLVTRPFGEDDGVETYGWDLDEETRPVFRDLRWTSETIAERL